MNIFHNRSSLKRSLQFVDESGIWHWRLNRNGLWVVFLPGKTKETVKWILRMNKVNQDLCRRKWGRRFHLENISSVWKKEIMCERKAWEINWGPLSRLSSSVIWHLRIYQMLLLGANLAPSACIFPKLDQYLGELGGLVWILQEQVMIVGYWS